MEDPVDVLIRIAKSIIYSIQEKPECACKPTKRLGAQTGFSELQFDIFILPS
jgi:hypothetical protein